MTAHSPQIDINSSFTLRLQGDEQPIIASVGSTGDGMGAIPREGYVLYGTEGQLQYIDGTIELEKRDGTVYRTEIEGGSGFKSLNRRKLQNFAASINGVTEPAVPGEVGLTVTAVTEAIYRAAETGTETSVQTLIQQADRP